MKQTAVEWLESKLNDIKSSSTNMNGIIKFIQAEFKELIEQAKEMEEEQNKNLYSEEDIINK